MSELQADDRSLFRKCRGLQPRSFTCLPSSTPLILLSLCLTAPSWATPPPDALQGLGIQEHLGEQLNLKALDGGLGKELELVNEQDQAILLSSYFNHKKPILLTLVYYECPMLCSLVLNGALESLQKIDWTVGKEFDVITLSIHPGETPSLARKKKATYLSRYARPHAEEGWHFLTGQETAIQSLAAQIGFKYRYDPVEKQYIHAAAIFVLTPEGKISRYLYGTTFNPQNLKLALLEASEGKVTRTTLDRVLLFCFHFDPNKNSYTLRLWRIVQVVLCIQVLVLAGLMGTLWRREKIS